MSNDPNPGPCRFCGSSDTTVTNREHKIYTVKCCWCSAVGPVSLSEDMAIQYWNGLDKRSASEPPTN